MSLGVLNNLSAMYAESSLNNSNTSLSNTLQQLSSGSKINSGSDDAAGLSLVDGLGANSAALSQSKTNAQEGVGLLQVADGALSQVTNLLNRAVTLATEASNGTLNSSQDTAANQEYQSILSEVNNIGTTTTYNDAAVFNSNTNIYTGDSSSTGASIDDLNIRSLSSSNVGDSGGAMAYSSGGSKNSVFIDLTASGGGAIAGSGDALSAATSTVNIDTLSSTGTTLVNPISVGAGTGFNDTAQGLINAINASGDGVTASFTTAAVAGASGTQTDTGIMITGSVGAGTNPTSASFSGVASTTGEAEADVLTGSITFQVGNNAATTVSMAQVAAATTGATVGSVKQSDLEAYIQANPSLGITASHNANNQLTFSAVGNASLKVSSNLTDQSLTTGPALLNYTATGAYSAGIANSNVEDGANTQTVLQDAVAGTQGTGGTATISYTDKAGTSLSGTDLSNQGDAQVALTSLNAAITAVAAQDGYIGAQINTLNSVSQVLGTQQENVISAQNAVQATDYATATSNMSKYQILSQTGISALAQANSMQQEVTKLLQ